MVTNTVEEVRSKPWAKWADDTRWWLWQKRKPITALVVAAVALFILFYAWHCFSIMSMSHEEYSVYMYGAATSAEDKHLSSREVIRKVALKEASITARQYHAYADVDPSIFKACQPLSSDDLASGLLVLNLRDAGYTDTIKDFRDGGGEEPTVTEEQPPSPLAKQIEEVDHVVVTLEELCETNERLLLDMIQDIAEEERDGVMLMMIPKFWNVTSPEEAEILGRASFNPCVLSTRLPGGLVVTMFNPVATNDIYAITQDKYANKTPKNIYASPEDTFPFWDHTAHFFTTLRLRYNEWPARTYYKPTITDFRGVEAIYFQIYLQYLYATNLFEDMMTSR